jgi:RNA-directed DNA polymerase
MYFQGEARLILALMALDPAPVYLHLHSEVAITRHVKVQGNRSPYDGDWVYWSTRQGRHPDASPKLAKLLKTQHGRCRYCGLFGPGHMRLCWLIPDRPQKQPEWPSHLDLLQLIHCYF